MNAKETIPVHEVDDSTVYNLYEKREPIYTRRIEGFFQRVRTLTGWPLLLGYFLTPWIELGDRPAILFDLPARQFHIFWLTFYPQDFVLLGWALMISAFALFFFTNLAGRVWCGYTCPQTVWTAMFMWAEQVSEGERQQRIKLANAPWDLNKIVRRTLKHGMWLVIAGLTGVTFVSYFYGIKPLIVDSMVLELPLVAGFWCAFFTAATYINAGWMREQVCKYMCPYARFQSAMFDKDTLLVSYDKQRGEQRGARKRSIEDPSTVGLGDCIDCTWCVQVCPTGIDIRDGLQYECINCARCVDACDSIMDKMGYERGLVSYTTENKEAGLGWTWKRPRLLGYGLALTVMTVLFTYNVFDRDPLAIDVLRDRNALYQELSDGRIQNSYLVKAMNRSGEGQRYEIVVSGVEGVSWVPTQPVFVNPGQVEDIAMSISLPADVRASRLDVTLRFANAPSIFVNTEVPFIGPQD